jgi:hypothetical protein
MRTDKKHAAALSAVDLAVSDDVRATLAFMGVMSIHIQSVRFRQESFVANGEGSPTLEDFREAVDGDYDYLAEHTERIGRWLEARGSRLEWLEKIIDDAYEELQAARKM